MPDLVSVLVPAYNASRWIRYSIDSVLRQSWPRIELIIVDDGSKDNTAAIAKAFESPSVKVVRQENAGASAARNRAYSLAQGEYVQWLDADDVLAPSKIATQMAEVEAERDNCALFSSAWAYFRYRTSKASFRPTPLWQDATPVEWLQRKFQHNLFMPPNTWLVSRTLTEAAGPWNTDLSLDDDGEYFARVVARSTRIRFLRKAEAYYRVLGAETLSKSYSRERIESQFNSMNLQIEQLCRLDDGPETGAAIVAFLESALWFFHPESPDLVREASAMAQTYGTTLKLPKLPKKYSVFEKFLGYSRARGVQRTYNKIKASALGNSDHFMLKMSLLGRRQNGVDGPLKMRNRAGG